MCHPSMLLLGLFAATLNPSLVQLDPLPQPVSFLSFLSLSFFTVHHLANATSCLSGTGYLPQGSVTPIKWGSSELDEMQFLCLSAGHFISQRISVLWSPPRSWCHSKYMASPFILWPHSEGWRKKTVVKVSMSPHSKPHSKCSEPRHCGLWGSLSPATSSP